MSLESLAANVAPPRSNVYCRPNSGTAAVFVVPEEWKTNFVTFTTFGDNIWVNFGTSSVDVDIPSGTTDASTVSSGVLTVDATTGFPIPAGKGEPFLIPEDVTHFAVIADGTTGHWYAYMSVNPRIRP